MAIAPQVHGYHGTSIQAATSILQQGFRGSRNSYDWLGDGVYFWQDAPARAWQWASAKWGPQAAVVGSLLSLDDCLDLLDIRWDQPLAIAYQSLVVQLQQQQLALPTQSPGAHRMDRAVINYAIRLLGHQGVPIGAVRSAFREGTPIYPSSYLYTRSHVQIAIRDLSLIRQSWLEPSY